MKKVSADSLIIEVTRKCNMHCEHCLRGKAENMDIDFSVIDAVLNSMKFIGSITFTGGEPSLNIKAMTYFREQAEKKGIEISSFYVVTNGKANTLDLSIELLKLHEYCSRYSDDTLEFSGVALSSDPYHDNIDPTNERILRGLSFFTEEKMFDDDKDMKLVNEGNAKENHIGQIYRYIEEVSIIDYETDWFHVDSIIYVNALGDVIPGCDFSYETQDVIKMGNILEKNLFDILEESIQERSEFDS